MPMARSVGKLSASFCTRRANACATRVMVTAAAMSTEEHERSRLE